MANTSFSVNGSKIIQSPGYAWFNWWRPGAAARTIVDGSNPPQLVPPVSPPVWAATTYKEDDEISDTTNLQRCIVPGTTSGVAPAWSTALFGLTADSGGVVWMNMGPIGGRACGHRDGAITVKLGGKVVPIGSDYNRAPVRNVFMADNIEIDMTLKQSDLNLLAYAVPSGQLTSGTDSLLPAGAQTYTEITFGGINSPIVPSPSIVVAIPKRPITNPAKCHVITGYKMAASGEISPPYGEGKDTTYKLTFKGEAVTSRADYDQVAQWYEMT